MSMKNTFSSELERFADSITLLKRGPHAASEIAAILGVGPNTARHWCKVWTDKGHAREAGAKRVGKNWATAWEWVQ